MTKIPVESAFADLKLLADLGSAEASFSVEFCCSGRFSFGLGRKSFGPTSDPPPGPSSGQAGLRPFHDVIVPGSRHLFEQGEYDGPFLTPPAICLEGFNLLCVPVEGSLMLFKELQKFERHRITPTDSWHFIDDDFCHGSGFHQFPDPVHTTVAACFL
jgi:hypothetical protein